MSMPMPIKNYDLYTMDESFFTHKNAIIRNDQSTRVVKNRLRLLGSWPSWLMK